ncbi:Hypothetical protein FKW44_012436, partial [Caligus rogercresseyi]
LTGRIRPVGLSLPMSGLDEDSLHFTFEPQQIIVFLDVSFTQGLELWLLWLQLNLLPLHRIPVNQDKSPGLTAKVMHRTLCCHEQL